jgi:hypothetical protein
MPDFFNFYSNFSSTEIYIEILSFNFVFSIAEIINFPV